MTKIKNVSRFLWITLLSLSIFWTMEHGSVSLDDSLFNLLFTLFLFVVIVLGSGGTVFCLFDSPLVIAEKDETYYSGVWKNLIIYSAAVEIFSVASGIAVWGVASHLGFLQEKIVFVSFFSALSFFVAYNELSVLSMRIKKFKIAVYEENLLFGIG